jgi:hypothetical protein
MRKPIVLCLLLGRIKRKCSHLLTKREKKTFREREEEKIAVK